MPIRCLTWCVRKEKTSDDSFWLLVCGLSLLMLMEPQGTEAGLPEKKVWSWVMGKTRTWGSRWDSLLGHCPKSTKQGMACVVAEASLRAKLY